MPAFPRDKIMDLLLWRHAEAEDGEDDLKRRLTERGEKQARDMAAWIHRHRPKDMRVIVSPAARTQQTAEALQLPFETLRKIGPEACVSELIAASGWPHAKGAVLIVGHQPSLGRLASLLLAGLEADWSIKKGALWWLRHRERDAAAQTVVVTVQSPDLM